MTMQCTMTQATALPGAHTVIFVDESSRGYRYLCSSRTVTRSMPIWIVATTSKRADGAIRSHHNAFRQKRHAEMWLAELL